MLDVAITGSGIVSGLGCGVDRFHQAMMAGEVGHPGGAVAQWRAGAAELVGDRA